MYPRTDLRTSLIESLLRLPGVRQTSPGAAYEITFPTVTGGLLTLGISLSPRFPQEPPQLVITPPVYHPLLHSPSGFVLPHIHPNLERWNPHADFGKTIADIIETLRYPPSSSSASGATPYSRAPTGSVVLPPPGATGSFYPPPPPYPGAGPSSGAGRGPAAAAGAASGSSLLASGPPAGGAAAGHGASPRPATAGGFVLPVVPARLADLDKYSEAELAEMLKDEKMLDAVFENLEVVKQLRAARTAIKESNSALCRDNLAALEALQERQADLVVKQQDLATRKATYDQKAKERDAIVQRFSTPHIIEELSKSMQEIDRQSEEVAQQFFDKKIDYHEFSRQYLELRKLFHTRAAKREALMHQASRS